MTEKTDSAGTPRVRPGEGAWLEAKREVADRNDRARKAGNAERRAREQREQAARRLAEQNGVYR
jgi:hypothetical protein